MQRTLRNLLGIVLILGGILGLGILRGAFQGGPFGVAVALALFYLANVVAGWWLWTKPRLGVSLTVVLQALQLVYVDGPTFKYHLANAAGAWLRQTSGSPEFSFHWGSSYFFAHTTGFGDLLPSGATYYGINLFAPAVAILACALWPPRATDSKVHR